MRPYPLVANRLLAQLPQAELDRLRPLARVRLVTGQMLIERGQMVEHVFFLEEGIASLMAQADHAAPGVQVAMIGREGMVGALALLDAGSAAHGGTVMRVPGSALRVPVAQLRRCLDDSPVLHGLVMRFVQSFARQVMSNAAWNASHTLAERCVHWLLMAHERMDGDDVPVTHGVLSAMLGVRRSGVTVATAALQRDGLISTGRGRIRILDRDGLERRIGVPPPVRPADAVASAS